MGVLIFIAMLGFGALLYLLPAFIAAVRRRPNTAAILVLNLFLGWTFIGWVGALVWSFTNAPDYPSLNG